MKSLLIISFFLVSSFVDAQDKESFRELLTTIIERDPSFKEVEFQNPVYDSQVQQSFSKLLLPKVSLHYGRYEQHNNLNLNSAGEIYRYGGVNAGLTLFNFGHDFNIYRSSQLERKVQDQRVKVQLMVREKEIALLVLEYLKELRNISILKRLLTLKEKALEVSKNRYERGILSEQDYSKVKIDVSNARAELFVAEQNFNLNSGKVKAYGVEDLPSEYPWEKELTHLQINKLLDIPRAIEDLPQYQEVALAEEASDLRRLAAKGVMFGNVNLNFSRSYYAFEDQNQWEWRTSLVYTLPLFDQFDQYNDFKRIEAQKKSNEIRKRFELKQTFTTQAAENANIEISWKNWIERSEALLISSKLYNNSLFQFNQGQLSVNELFVDQDRLLRTEQIANLALHQLHVTVLSFCHSRGRAFVKGCF